MINQNIIRSCYVAYNRAKKQKCTQYVYEDHLGTVISVCSPPVNVLEFMTVTSAGTVTRMLKSLKQSSFLL